MGCVYLVELVVGLYAFSIFMGYPLLQQYVYRRLWLKLSDVPYPVEHNNIYCAVNSTNLTSIHADVQREASFFLLYIELGILLPSLVSSPLLVASSDLWGRKLAMVSPLLGHLIFASTCFAVAGLSLNLRFLLGAAVSCGCLGGFSALLGGCFAYVADRCGLQGGDEDGAGAGAGGSSPRCESNGFREEADGEFPKEQVGNRREESSILETDRGGMKQSGTDNIRGARGRTVRMAGLEMTLGVLSGLASLCAGFFIHSSGFTWPFLTTALLHALNLGYVSFVLRESLSAPPAAVELCSSPSSSSPPPSRCSLSSGGCCGSRGGRMVGQLQEVCVMLASGTRKRKAALALMLTAFALYKGSSQGGSNVFVLYELNEPLCWSEVLIGYASLLTVAICVCSFAGVYVLSRCLRDTHVVLLGLLSVSAGLLMAAFAKSTLLMFLVRVPLVLSAMPNAVLRSMMSNTVLSSEQGSVFSCIAFVELLSMVLALTLFNSTYAATVSWFSGFSFLLASCITVIPAVLIGVLTFLRIDEEGVSRLLDEEETQPHFSRVAISLSQS